MNKKDSKKATKKVMDKLLQGTDYKYNTDVGAMKIATETQHSAYLGNAWWLRRNVLLSIFWISVGVFIFYSKTIALILILWPLAVGFLKIGHRRGFASGYDMAQKDLKKEYK